MKNMRKVLYLSIVVSCLVISSDCEKNIGKYKILALFPHPGVSHFAVFKPLLEELARRGHELTVVSHFPRKEKLPNYRDINLEDTSGVMLNIMDVTKLDQSDFHVLSELEMIFGMAQTTCLTSFEKQGVKELLNSNERFDVILTEVFNTDCFLGFVHKFKAPFIGISTHQLTPWANHRLENPDNPSYIPHLFTALSQSMNFLERVANTVVLTFCKIVYEIKFNGFAQERVKQVFGPDVPPLRELAKNMSALLVNTHFSIHGSRPYSNGVVEVGGLHIRPAKPLPKNIKDFLDSAKDGVLYFNWGSMVKTASIPEDKLQAIIKVIGNLKQKVLWKWEDKEMPNKPKNLMLQDWLPQFDILNHPNVKAFLTHGGLLGISEAMYTGVPILGVPMFGDQFHNVGAVVGRGAGKVLYFNDITEESFRSAVNDILNNPSYRKNAQAVSEAYRDRPASALETSVWWVEYIARGKGQPFLKSASAGLTWYQYHLLDVIAFLFTITMALLCAVFFTLKFLVGFITDKKTQVKRHSNGSTNNGVHKKKEA